MGGTRVLYIDDDPGVSRLVQRHLERSGFSVHLARSGEEGLRALEGEPFGAVALDHYMPGRDGLEVLQDIVQRPEAPPVIFVTAAEEPRIAVTALKAGAADYVVKDVQGVFLELLATAIQSAMNAASVRRARAAAELELRRSRDRLEQLTAQQAVLLREVNHRVANSLQLISSLIELQGRKLPDQEARAVLQRAADRVEAVALVHRRLYTDGDVDSVEMDQYLTGLIDELRRAVESEEAGHRILLKAEAGRVPTDQAVGVGLIVNEWVTNALKYAYAEGHPGEIRVRFANSGTDWQLVVEDDGIGYPTANHGPRGSGLGGLIVDAMARTVRGSVALDRSHSGTRFILSFGA